MKRAILLIAFLASISLSYVFAQEEAAVSTASDLGFEFSGELNFSSIYMWRGIMLDGDAVIQPGFYIKSPKSKLGRLKLGIWGSYDMENRDALRSDETDFIIDYTYSLRRVDLSTGFIYYFFPQATPSDGAPNAFSREAYLAVALPGFILAPSLYYYYDFGNKEDGGGRGSYSVLNLAYSKPFEIRKMSMSLDAVGHVGYNNKLYYRGKGGDFGASLGVTVPLTKSLTCKPNINYALPWGNLSDKNNGNQKNRFYYALYLSYAFK